MPNGHVLELSTLRAIHPKCAMLEAYATPTIIRLSLDPTTLPSGTMVREVTVEWLARPGGSPAQQVSRDIGWSNLPQHAGDVCIRWMNTQNERSITEGAAIGIMALLVHDLEGAEVRSVLQIGSGGDYVLTLRSGGRPVQSEVSGIRIDPNGGTSRDRVREKCQQVLTQSSCGFASVTTFSHGAAGDVHSFLHYATAPPRKKAKPGKKRKRP